MQTEITARMKPDGVHVYVDGELELTVENDPYDLVMRIPSTGFLMFKVDDAVTEIFGALNTQEYLGLVTLLGMVIYTAFEEQDKFLQTTAQ